MSVIKKSKLNPGVAAYDTEIDDAFVPSKFDLPPEPREHDIDGTVHTLYRPPKDDPDKTYKITFVVEVPSSLFTKKTVKVKVLEGVKKLQVTVNYSPSILDENILQLKQFGGHSSHLMAVTKWGESCNKI